MARQSELRLRLSAKGKKELIDALRGMGHEGARAAQQIERAGRKASDGLRLTDNTVKSLRRNLESTASQLPLLGDAVQGMGAGFQLAAAGVQVLVRTLTAAMRIAREALTEFDAIAKAADDYGFSTDYFQGIEELARQESVQLERVNTAMASFARNSSRAATGRGEMVEMLRLTHPELLREISLLDSADDRLDVYIRALAAAESQTERNLLATAAFGDSGFEVARMLQQVDGGMSGFIERARSMGLIIDESILRRAEEMETRMAVASRVIDLNLKQAFIELAPVLVDSAEFFADVAREIREIADAFKDIEDRSTASLQTRANELAEALHRLNVRRLELLDDMGGDLETFYGPGADQRENGQYLRNGEQRFSARLQLLDHQADNAEERLEALLDELRGRGGEGGAGGEGAEDLQRIIELTQHVASVRDASATSAERLAASLALLREAREAGIIQSDEELARLEAAERQRHANTQAARDQAQAEREAAQARAELGDFTGLVALRERELAELVEREALSREQAAEILTLYRDRLEASTDEARRAAAVIESVQTPLDIYTAQIAELDDLLAKNRITTEIHTRAVEMAREAYEAADPVYQTAARVRRELLTNEELLAEETRAVTAAVRAGALDWQQAGDYLERYAEMLERSAGSTETLAFHTELLDRILGKQVESWNDLADVALTVLRGIIAEQIRLADTTRGFGSYLTDILAGIAGSFGLGSSSSRPSFDAGVASGTAPGTGAGRPDTGPPPSGSAQIHSQGSGVPGLPSALPSVNFTLIDQAGVSVQTDERRSPDGSVDLKILLRREVEGMVRDGELDGVFGSRFGASPVPLR